MVKALRNTPNICIVRIGAKIGKISLKLHNIIENLPSSIFLIFFILEPKYILKPVLIEERVSIQNYR